MRYYVIILSSFLICGCTTAHKTKTLSTTETTISNTTETTQTSSKKARLQQIVEKVKICFECKGSTNPGGPCYSGPGGARSIHPGGMCYSGPGGNLSISPGGNMYAGPGGNRYAGPGGNCYAGPGGACAQGIRSESCPKICRLDPTAVK